MDIIVDFVRWVFVWRVPGGRTFITRNADWRVRYLGKYDYILCMFREVRESERGWNVDNYLLLNVIQFTY